MNYCEECGRNTVELHHIIFKSQAPYMANIKANFKYLCPECHRGNKGPHMNREKSLEYKLKLQKKLFEIFNQQYYSEKNIQQKLETSSSEVKKITKKLKLYKEGYERVDIIQRLMGGCIYGKQ